MKKIIYLLLSIVLISCGSRNTEKEKTKESEKASLNQFSESKSDISKIENTEKSESKTEDNSVAQDFRTTELSKSDSEKSGEKSNSENSSEIEKIREYYENGKLKSERETSKNYSKLSQEKDYWKSSAESLREDNLKILENSKLIYRDNLKLQRNNQKLITTNNKSLSKLQKTSLELSKKTESKRDSWWLYVLIVVVSIIGWELLTKYNRTGRMFNF
ncbi:hypothetical protein [Epilithonimonas caeni]|uniref:hypothetical protein n=1 Tax=Epilithonimonas caeni TaxID=365343 RepID=UPI0004862FF7|nr:hypothetical protein [Epilithonimonas caeni]